IHTIGENHLLSVHMLQHVLIGDLGIALMVVAVRGPLLVFMLPPRVLGPIARDRDVRAVLSFLLRPPVAFGLWAVNLAVWHIPSLYISALLHPALHELAPAPSGHAPGIAHECAELPVRAGVPRARGRRRSRVRMGRAKGAAAATAHRTLRNRTGVDRRVSELAARDDRGQAASARASAP